MDMNAGKWRAVAGWAGVVLSSAIAIFWAFWGSIENFHEGWYGVGLWQNVGLMLAQYLSPMLLTIALSAVALRWRVVALPLTLVAALALGIFFHGNVVPIVLIALPLLVLGLLFHFGDPKPRSLAFACLIGLPISTALACGAVPGWRAFHRFDDGDYAMRYVRGNGVALVWAPSGPGWPETHATWQEAVSVCEHLSRNGLSLDREPQNIWRLPTVEEAVRSLVFRGKNAGGTWDVVSVKAQYRVTPDKDSPLWKLHSPVIYWWTATRIGSHQVYRIAFNGYVVPLEEHGWGDYWAFRCVRTP